MYIPVIIVACLGVCERWLSLKAHHQQQQTATNLFIVPKAEYYSYLQVVKLIN